jgi:hypothetical protein
MRESARIILVVLLAVACAPRTHADTIGTFDISGTETSSCLLASAAPIPGCTPIPEAFSGVLTVDVTTGIVPSVYIPLFGTPGLPPRIEPFPGGVQLVVVNEFDQEGILDFSTPTQGSLVGFDGGTIFGFGGDGGNSLSALTDPSGVPLYYVLGGSITPAPEPTPLTLILLGLVGLVAMRKRMRARSATGV